MHTIFLLNNQNSINLKLNGINKTFNDGEIKEAVKKTQNTQPQT